MGSKAMGATQVSSLSKDRRKLSAQKEREKEISDPEDNKEVKCNIPHHAFGDEY